MKKKNQLIIPCFHACNANPCPIRNLRNSGIHENNFEENVL